MRIVQIAAEFAPLAKAGGLGEVIVGLSRELSRLHEDVEVIIPKYDFIAPAHLTELQLKVPEFKSVESGRHYSNAMWSATIEGSHVSLLESRHPAGYFHRERIYGYEDDTARFLYFCRAVVEYLKLQKKPIDILHLHDWHTGAVAPLVRDLFAHELNVKSIVLSIHNVEYQGKCSPSDLSRIGLNGNSYLAPEKLQDDDPKQSHTINLLKAGIVYSDAVVAVSPTYAKEILTPTYGFHLDTTLRKMREKVSGILNGIDLTLWNPAQDPYISTHFSSTDSIVKIDGAKNSNKQTLCTRFGLKANHRPWVGAVTRLVPQKGPELLEQALMDTVEAGGTYILLGSSPFPHLQHHFESLKKKYEQNPNVLLHLEYDEALAHQIYAALDLLLIPSHFEPCGLTQMIGLHYGTLPIARATGGLKDTVIDCGNPFVENSQRNGFLFEAPTPAALTEALQRAIDLYKTDPSTFQHLMRRGMQIDFSWKKPTQEYLKLYRKLKGSLQSFQSLSDVNSV